MIRALMCSYMENRDRRESDINSPETECYLVAVYPKGKDCELPTALHSYRVEALLDRR
jgi:hypothetical protein